MIETAGRAERLVLAQVLHGDGRKGFTAVFDEVAEHRLVVVSDEKNFFDLWHFGDGTHAMLDYGVAGDFEKRLRDVEGKRAEACASRWASDLGEPSALDIGDLPETNLRE